MNKRLWSERIFFCLLLWMASAGFALADTPHIGIQSPASIPTITNAPLTLKLNFIVAVSDFTANSVVTSNAQVTNFSGSGANYQFTIQPLADGLVTFSIPAQTVHSSDDGSGNVALAPITFTYDATQPSLILSSTTTSPTGAPIAVTATFSEPVTGFDISQIVVTNGSVSNFVASTSSLYTFTVTSAIDGTTTIQVAAGVAHDPAGNQNLSATPLEFLFSDAPLATLSFFDLLGNAVSSVTSGNSVVVHATFSEPTKVTPTTTIAVSGADTIATTTMTRTDDTHYTYTYTAGPTSGTDVVVVDGAVDLAGNPQISASSSILVIVLPPPPPPSPPVGGGGGGGGGGGQSAINSAPAPVSSVANEQITVQQVDVLKDGVIDILDYNSLMVNWGVLGDNPVDINKDGVVDVLDFNLIMAFWSLTYTV